MIMTAIILGTQGALTCLMFVAFGALGLPLGWSVFLGSVAAELVMFLAFASAAKEPPR